MTATTTRPVALEELRRAWHAVQDGAFRPRPALHPSDVLRGWDPVELVLPVVGIIPQAGATTIALALATVGGGRVVECCTATASGLGAAATAEMGVTPAGWAIGRRDTVHIARASTILRRVEDVPIPDAAPAGTGSSVLDVGWDLGQVLTGENWLTAALTTASRVLVVTTVTVPGLRRVQVAAELLGPDRVVVAARGPQLRRWPREARGAAGSHVRALDEAGRWVAVPYERGLAVRGLDPTPLPRPLLAVAQDLWRRCDADGHRSKEHS